MACFTPLPPARTGVADYAAALLPHLGRLCTLEVFTDGDHRPGASGGPATFPHEAYEARRRQGGFDCTVFQLGNHAGFHGFMYPYLLRLRGVTVLHDLSLLHFQVRRHRGPGGLRALLAEVEHSEGPDGRAALFAMLRAGGPLEPLRLPMLRRVVEASRSIVTLSRWGRDRIVERWPAREVQHIPQGVSPVADGAGAAVRQALGWGAAEVVVASVGLIDQPERTALLARAFGRARAREPALRLLLVGVDREALAPACRTLLERLPDRAVNVVGYAPDGIDPYVAACDVLVRLRHPTAGESSSVIARAFAAGRPVVATDAPALREIRGGFCLRVRPGPAEEETLAAALCRLAADPARRRRLGTAARRHVRGDTWARVAERYRDLLQATVERPP